MERPVMATSCPLPLLAQTKNGRTGTTADVAALLKAEAPTGRTHREYSDGAVRPLMRFGQRCR
jgi:hypothetical protein